jgi:cell wall-associated NlpC family hydrolase
MSSSATKKLAAGAATLTVAGVACFIAVVGGAVAGDQGSGIGVSFAAMLVQASEACVVGGPVRGLDGQQAANADQIVSAAFAASGENYQVARIALMVAWTESGLRDLGPLPANDGSLGLFQQRGWASAEQEMTPTVSTGLFVSHLLALPAWMQLPPWVAAQDVQQSRFSDGSNYRANWPRAGQLLNRVVANGDQLGSCGQDLPAGITGPVASRGLPSGYAIPPGTGPAHTLVVAWALNQLGKPYLWGAAGPGAFDCSGLTMAAWATAGVRLLHYTVDQQRAGAAVSATASMAGDLVLIPGSDAPGPGQAGHVGIYLGDGLVESAVDPQVGVIVQSWQSFIGGGLVALRDPDPSDG